MKVILAHTYFLKEDEQEKRIMKPYPPLGLLYLSAYLKQNDIDVSVYDTTFSSFPKLIRFLNRAKPDVLGIHCNLLTKYNVMKLIRYCRKKGIISVLGGPDASTQVKEFLNYGANIVISGEGEEVFLSVVNRLKKNGLYFLHDIPNVSFRDSNGKIVENQRCASRRSLNDFPFPDREAINLNRYLRTWEKHHKQRPVSLVTARGCAFTCKWCSHSVYGFTHRRRSPENVIAEIKEIIQKYNPTHLWFADDVFTVSKRWLQNFHKLMKAENIHLPFECIARADRLDEEIVTILRELGCYRIWYGAESGSQHVLNAMSRGVTRQQIRDATGLCRKYHIESGIFVMFGYPGEELTDILETIRFIRDLQPDHYLTTVAYPLRGTAMYEEFSGKVIYHSPWEKQLQRELDMADRFPKQLYKFASRKLASEFRKKQLALNDGSTLKMMFYGIKTRYCDYQIRKLSAVRTA